METKTQRHGGTEKAGLLLRPFFYNKELTDKIIASAIEVHTPVLKDGIRRLVL